MDTVRIWHKRPNIDELNKNRIAVAKQYNELLESPSISTPKFEDNMSHVFHQYTLLSKNRDAISRQLDNKNIGHAIYYSKPLSEQTAFKSISRAENLKNTKNICEKCISLPMFPELSDEQIVQVVNAVKSA